MWRLRPRVMRSNHNPKVGMVDGVLVAIIIVMILSLGILAIHGSRKSCVGWEVEPTGVECLTEVSINTLTGDTPFCIKQVSCHQCVAWMPNREIKEQPVRPAGIICE